MIAGPTAAGKTKVAIEAARLLGGEIVCADSMQIYRRLDVGTAKPTPQERAQIPHHLVDILEPDAAYSVADYVRDANAAIDAILARGALPVVCGGTGLYIDSLVSGVEFIERDADDALRAQIREDYEKNGIGPLLAEIERADPDFARTLHPNNIKRILRAVEKQRVTGLTEAQRAARSRQRGSRFERYYAVLGAEDRARLYARIEARVEAMMRAGLLREARYVYDNAARFATAREAIGYKEFFGYFGGTQSLEDCVALLKKSTRRYAKRQLTWFRHVSGAVWYAADEAAQITAKAIADDFVRVSQ